jgi:hypothetical protein
MRPSSRDASAFLIPADRTMLHPLRMRLSGRLGKTVLAFEAAMA